MTATLMPEGYEPPARTIPALPASVEIAATYDSAQIDIQAPAEEQIAESLSWAMLQAHLVILSLSAERRDGYHAVLPTVLLQAELDVARFAQSRHLPGPNDIHHALTDEIQMCGTRGPWTFMRVNVRLHLDRGDD